MPLPFPIAASQTDAKSPVDDTLMDAIRLNLDYLETQVSGGAAIFNFNVNGQLSLLNGFNKPIDTAVNFSIFTPTFSRAVIKKSGTSGQLRYDIRTVSTPKTPIVGIDHQFDGLTQSIANIAPGLLTQSIQRSTAQIATQSITLAKPTLNIQSIISLGNNRWRYNLNVAPDSDWVAGDIIRITGATAGGNNGSFTLDWINDSGFPSIVITNASGVAQLTPAGQINHTIMSYNFTNPVSTEFAPGEFATFNGHTNGVNNGFFFIRKRNTAGNNLWVINISGVVQAAPAGTCDVLRWVYTFTTPASATDFIVGENAKMASHTTGANNGNFRITAVNSGGNNVVVYNFSGAVQGGVAGNVNTNRWVYAQNTDPSPQVTALDRVSFENHTTGANNGIFTVVQVNRAGNNLVVYNESGVAQAGVAGNARHTRKIVKFATDESAVYTTSSFVEISGTTSLLYDEQSDIFPFQVLQVNRGGGSNFNIVIDGGSNPLQSSPAGYIMTEQKSIFVSPPIIPVDVLGQTPNQIIKHQSSNMIGTPIPANTPIVLYVLEVPLGEPTDLSITLQ